MINTKIVKRISLKKRKKIKIIHLKEMISNNKKFYIKKDQKVKLTNLQVRKDFPIKNNPYLHLPNMDKMLRSLKRKQKLDRLQKIQKT